MRYDLPLVSIVVVNFNYGHFLAQCLASIAEQTYGTIECIVVDNASTDDTRDVYDRFLVGLAEGKRRRFSFHAMAVNEHQTRASIAGYRLSQGHYVIFVDADDMLTPQCVRTHIQAHLSVRECVGLTCGDMLQLEGSELVASTLPGVAEFVVSGRGIRPRKFRSLSPSIIPSDDLLADAADLEGRLHFVEPRDTLQWPWSATSGFCYRREAVDLMFAYTPRICGSTDAYLAHGIAALTGGVVIDLPVGVYRRHGANIFSRHPALRGFYNFDVEKEVKTLKTIVGEVIASYLANATAISARIKDKTLYFDAIEALSKVADGLKPITLDVSSYMLEFLLLNRQALGREFGGSFVDGMIVTQATTRSDKREVAKCLREPLPDARAERGASATQGARAVSVRET